MEKSFCKISFQVGMVLKMAEMKECKIAEMKECKKTILHLQKYTADVESSSFFLLCLVSVPLQVHLYLK